MAVDTEIKTGMVHGRKRFLVVLSVVTTTVLVSAMTFRYRLWLLDGPINFAKHDQPMINKYSNILLRIPWIFLTHRHPLSIFDVFRKTSIGQVMEVLVNEILGIRTVQGSACCKFGSNWRFPMPKLVAGRTRWMLPWHNMLQWRLSQPFQHGHILLAHGTACRLWAGQSHQWLLPVTDGRNYLTLQMAMLAASPLRQSRLTVF